MSDPPPGLDQQPPAFDQSPADRPRPPSNVWVRAVPVLAVGALVVVAAIGMTLGRGPVTGTLSNVGGPIPVPSDGTGASAGANPTDVAVACEAAAALRSFMTGADALCPLVKQDGTRDWLEYSGAAASVQPAGLDIVAALQADVLISPQLAAALAARCGDGQVSCGTDPPIDGAYRIWMQQQFEKERRQEVAAFFERSIAIAAQPGGGVGSAPWDGQPADPLTGANLAYSRRFPSVNSGAGVAGPFRLAYDKDSANPIFLDAPTGAFTIESGQFLFTLVPAAEIPGAETFRVFTFYQEDGGGPSGVDLWPEPAQPPAPFSDLQPIQLQ